jgi:two-component system invasion response regulator UvrY
METIARNASLKILIADDHSVVRHGLKQILVNKYSNIEFGEAANSIEVLKEINKKQWDLLIMDINMPGRDGLEVLKQLKDEEIHVPVLILSMHPEEHMALRAFKSGAQGYLTKESAGDELLNAVNKILSGRKYITALSAEQLATQLENPLNKKPHELLSNREYQTTLLIASGKTVSQIAELLSLSVTTICTYRARILEKMNMSTNAELTTYSIRQQLL